MTEPDRMRMAFLDDRVQQRQTMVRGIQAHLPKTWECVECKPLPRIREFSTWIVANQISVLLVDQRLNEEGDEGNPPPDYMGHEVITSLRAVFPKLPIYAVTAVPDDPDLEGHLGAADDIVERDQLLENAEQYLERILRHGEEFFETHVTQLAELSSLSERYAAGGCSDEELNRLKALQTSLGLPSDGSFAEDALRSFENEVNRGEALRIEIEKFLQQHGQSN